jgi:nucleoside-diphosphate-sugar epimerase
MSNKKIAMLGAGSSVAKSILEEISNKNYDLDIFYRKDLDATDLSALKEKFKNKHYDLVINCAMSGTGRFYAEDSAQNFYENIIMQENLFFLQDHYSNLIIFSSGAQNSRKIDVINLKEEEFKEPTSNFYSLAKYVNAKRAIGNKKVINLRIFNAFTHFEKENRFIKNNIFKYLRKQPIEIWGDTYFDFFYSNDISKVIEYFIGNPPQEYTELNLVYDNKYKFSDIASIINNLSEHKVDIIIKEGQNKHYTGDGTKLKALNLNLEGLEKAIIKTYNVLKNESI